MQINVGPISLPLSINIFRMVNLVACNAVKTNLTCKSYYKILQHFHYILPTDILACSKSTYFFPYILSPTCTLYSTMFGSSILHYLVIKLSLAPWPLALLILKWTHPHVENPPFPATESADMLTSWLMATNAW